MATAPAHAGAAIAAGESMLSHGRVGTHPVPPRLGFLSKPSARWAAILRPPGPRHAAPAAAAAKERVTVEGPEWVELEPIAGEQQLDRVLAEAQQLDLPIVLLWVSKFCFLDRPLFELKFSILASWVKEKGTILSICSYAQALGTRMASWCRKCIYLKPKLEKLAAEYHPRIRFYCIDVNSVPQKLVNRAGVTKMPSIQLWSDSQKQAEVIGGHKSFLVIDDVRRMIEQEE